MDLLFRGTRIQQIDLILRESGAPQRACNVSRLLIEPENASNDFHAAGWCTLMAKWF
jgi:hypothetical protein